MEKSIKREKNGFFCGKRARFSTLSVEKVENSVEMLKNAVESRSDCSDFSFLDIKFQEPILGSSYENSIFYAV